MPANLCCHVIQLLGTLRCVRRWVMIGRVLQIARRELGAIAVLLLLLLLICTHLGNMVRDEMLHWKMFRCLTWLCFWFSFFPSQWKISSQWSKAESQWCQYFATRGFSKSSARSIQSWDLSMGFSCLAAAFGSLLDSVEQFSSLHIGTVYIMPF